MRFSPFDGLALIVPFAFLLFWLALVVVHVFFAIAVFRHSSLARERGFEPLFAPPPISALAALVTGVVGATCYWLMHCSNIRPHEPVPTLAVPPANPISSEPHA